DGLERGLVVLCVLDVVLDPRGLEGLLEVLTVSRLPACGRLAVGQDHTDLARRRRLRFLCRRGGGGGLTAFAPAGGKTESKRGRRGGQAEDPLAHGAGSFLPEGPG